MQSNEERKNWRRRMNEERNNVSPDFVHARTHIHTHTHTHTLVVRFSSRERAKNLPLLNKESELVFAIRYDFP